MNKDTIALILAAGKGRRMCSERPKVLHEICGLPLLGHVINAVQKAGLEQITVVVGHGREAVQQRFQDRSITWVTQIKQLGTGDAVLQAAPLLSSSDGNVLVLAGDMPLIRAETLQRMLKTFQDQELTALILTCELSEPGHLGRILRHPHNGRVTGIVEARDATRQQLAIKEINTSIYLFRTAPLYAALRQIKPDNAQGEYYLTDVIRILATQGYTITTVSATPEEALGVNSPAQLAALDKLMQQRIQDYWQQKEVTIKAPQTVYIEATAVLGGGTVVYPFSWIRQQARIGVGCEIGPFVEIAAGAVVADHSCIKGGTTVPQLYPPQPTGEQ